VHKGRNTLHPSCLSGVGLAQHTMLPGRIGGLSAAVWHASAFCADGSAAVLLRQ
jgi:hypothetical protein